MNSGKTVLAQLLAGLSSKEFSRCASLYPTTRDTPALSAYDHFATMVFAQLTYRESLRDIEVCLNARRPAVVSRRHSWRREALQSGLRERASGLADVCRGRERIDAPRAPALFSDEDLTRAMAAFLGPEK